MPAMLWAVLVFILVGVAGVVVLGLLGWRLFKQVRSLGRKVSTAGTQVAAANKALAAVQRDGTSGRRTGDW